MTCGSQGIACVSHHRQAQLHACPGQLYPCYQLAVQCLNSCSEFADAVEAGLLENAMFMTSFEVSHVGSMKSIMSRLSEFCSMATPSFVARTQIHQTPGPLVSKPK